MKYTAEIKVDWAINGYKLMGFFLLCTVVAYSEQLSQL